MAGSRLEKVGTIFGRMTGLLRAGAIKRENKPVWYDVYQVFPPKIEPSYGARRPMPEIREIFYPEDTIRAKFHQKIKRLPAENLLSTATTDLTRRAIELTQNILRENDALTEEQALDKAIETLKKEGFLDTQKARQRQSRKTKSKNPSSEKETSNRDDTQLQASATEESTPISEKSKVGDKSSRDDNLVQASAAEESTQSSETSRVRSLAKDYENAVKEISDKGVDISKILKDDK